MSEFTTRAIETIRGPLSKQQIFSKLVVLTLENGYKVAEVDDARPWGDLSGLIMRTLTRLWASFFLTLAPLMRD